MSLLNIFREEFPRFGNRRVVEMIRVYGEIVALYARFDNERNNGRVRAEMCNTILLNIEHYERITPKEIRRELDRDTNDLYNVQRIKDKITRAKSVAD